MALKFLKTRDLLRRPKKPIPVPDSQLQTTRQQTDLNSKTISLFLKLPVELRLYIYSYLIPNTEVPSRFQLPEVKGADDQRYVLRNDNQPCCPAILRVNRQIYKEVADLWYRSVTYSVMIRDGRISFLGADHYHKKGQFPATIRRIQSLKLYIIFRRWHRQPRGHGPWPSCTKLLANSILSGTYKLQTLELHIGGSLDEAKTFFGLDTCKTDLFRADLEWNLAPLRALRGVTLTYRDMLLGGPRGDNDWSILPLNKMVWSLEPEAILEQQHTLEKVFERFMKELAAQIA